MDSSISSNPFEPEGQSPEHAAAQEESAQAIAPPNTGEEQDPGSPNPEMFPAAQPEPEPDAPVEGLQFSDGSSVEAGAPGVEQQPEAVAPSGEPQPEPAPEASQEPAPASPDPAPEGQDAPTGSEPENAPASEGQVQ